MKPEEVLKLYTFAKVIWPTFNLPEDKLMSGVQDAIWYDMFHKYDVFLVYDAMKNVAKIENYCNISKVAVECENLYRARNNLPNIEEIKKKTLAEIRNAVLSYYPAYGFEEHNQEIFNNLSPLAQKVVGYRKRLGEWENIDDDKYVMFIEPQITKSIEIEIKREEDANSNTLQNILEFNNQKQLKE